MPSVKKIKVSKRRAVVISALILLITLTTAIIVQAQSSLPTVTLTGGVYPGASTYTITSDTGTTYAKTRFGTVAYSSTNASYVFNSVYSALSHTSLETVEAIGTFNITAPIALPDYSVSNFEGATFNLAANIAYMFTSDEVNAGMTRYAKVYGGTYNGQKATYNTASTAGFEGCFRDCWFNDLTIISFDGVGMNLESYDATNKSLANVITGCWFGLSPTGTGNAEGGLLIGNDGQGGADNIIDKCLFINNGVFQVKIEDDCHNNRISQFHIAGTAPAGETDPVGFWLYGDADKTLITNGHFENVDLSAVLLEPQASDFCDEVKITHNTIYKVAKATNNSVPAIWINSNTGQARFGQIGFNSFKADSGNEPTYAISLDGANSDYWIISGNTVESSGYATAWINDESGGSTHPANLTDVNVVI